MLKTYSYSLPILLTFISCVAFSQEVTSKTVGLDVNNRKDTLPPVIDLLSPGTEEGDLVVTHVSVTTLRGTVSDNSTLRLFAVNGIVRTLGGEGTFNTQVPLYPGRNEVRLVAVDVYNNLTEKLLTIHYQPEPPAPVESNPPLP